MKWWLWRCLSFLILIVHLRNIKTLLLLLTRCQAPLLLGVVWLDSGRRLLCNLMFSDSFLVWALILKSSPVRWIPNDRRFYPAKLLETLIYLTPTQLTSSTQESQLKTGLAFNQSLLPVWQISTLSVVRLQMVLSLFLKLNWNNKIFLSKSYLDVFNKKEKSVKGKIIWAPETERNVK